MVIDEAFREIINYWNATLTRLFFEEFSPEIIRDREVEKRRGLENIFFVQENCAFHDAQHNCRIRNLSK